MKSLVAAVITIGLLSGCSQSVPEVPRDNTLHPSWPDPIKPYTGKWQVKIIDDRPWVGMPFDESQEFRIWLNDVNRWAKDANGMICYYRKDLNETRCKQWTH